MPGQQWPGGRRHPDVQARAAAAKHRLDEWIRRRQAYVPRKAGTTIYGYGGVKHDSLINDAFSAY